MRTLKERAEEYVKMYYDTIGNMYQSEGMKVCYTDGAIQQQEIDIERAWKHIEDWFEEDEKRVAKLALTKTMKGE